MKPMKQLKKNDFLAHVTPEPMTREQLVDALDEYDYIRSYLDFLIDHFEKQGKVIKNEDGTIQRKSKAPPVSKIAYCVVEQDDTFVLESREQLVALTNEEKLEGWATTANAAIKRMSSVLYQDYRSKLDALKTLEEPAAAKEAA